MEAVVADIIANTDSENDFIDEYLAVNDDTSLYYNVGLESSCTARTRWGGVCRLSVLRLV